MYIAAYLCICHSSKMSLLTNKKNHFFFFNLILPTLLSRLVYTSLQVMFVFMHSGEKYGCIPGISVMPSPWRSSMPEWFWSAETKLDQWDPVSPHTCSSFFLLFFFSPSLLRARFSPRRRDGEKIFAPNNLINPRSLTLFYIRKFNTKHIFHVYGFFKREFF